MKTLFSAIVAAMVVALPVTADDADSDSYAAYTVTYPTLPPGVFVPDVPTTAVPDPNGGPDIVTVPAYQTPDIANPVSSPGSDTFYLQSTAIMPADPTTDRAALSVYRETNGCPGLQDTTGGCGDANLPADQHMVFDACDNLGGSGYTWYCDEVTPFGNGTGNNGPVGTARLVIFAVKTECNGGNPVMHTTFPDPNNSGATGTTVGRQCNFATDQALLMVA